MKRRYKKKAEFGLNEALLNKDLMDSNLANSKNKISTNQANQQSVEDSLISAGSKLGVGPLGKVSNYTSMAGNAISQNAIKNSGDIKKGQYAAGKAIKYGGAGVSLGSFDPTGTTSAVLGAAGTVVGATTGLLEAGKMERRYKNIKKTQDNLDTQFRVGQSVNDRTQANQAKKGKRKILINSKDKSTFGKESSRKWKRKKK